MQNRTGIRRYQVFCGGHATPNSLQRHRRMHELCYFRLQLA